MTQEQHTCPRRAETGLDNPDSPFRGSGTNLDTWRTTGGLVGQEHTGLSCSYCGSLNPDRFLELVRDNWIVEPTDKNYKCQPTGTMVRVVTQPNRGGHTPAQAVDRPIEILQAGDRVVSYNSADAQFIKNGREILNVGSRSYSGNLIRVAAGPNVSRYTPEHICMVRIADGFAGHHVYLMKRGNSYRIGRCRGWSGTQKTPGVLYRARTEGADGIWVLAAFTTQREASLAEATLSWRYNIPGLTFRAANTSTLLDQSALDQFWGSVGDLSASAKALLADYERDERFPMWAPQTGRGFWRTRAVEMRAANLLDGMEMITADGGSLPISVSRERYDGAVYSLAVEREETYIADGLVTHNCYLGKPLSDEEKAERKERWLAGMTYDGVVAVAQERGETPEQYRAALAEHYDRDVARSESAGTQAKFYFQHLSVEQQNEFIELHNSRVMKVSGGGFYVRPYFAGPGAE